MATERSFSNKNSLCPCCSGLEYQQCCQQYHQGTIPKTPLALMRSRYSAYAKDLPQYIMETTHPDNPNFKVDKNSWAQEIMQFSRNTQFNKLEIVESQEGTTEGFVTFTAHLAKNGQDASFTEKSRFHKIGDRWLYRDGVITKGRKFPASE